MQKYIRKKGRLILIHPDSSVWSLFFLSKRESRTIARSTRLSSPCNDIVSPSSFLSAQDAVHFNIFYRFSYEKKKTHRRGIRPDVGLGIRENAQSVYDHAD